MSRVEAFTDRPDLLMAVIEKSGKLLWANLAFATFSNYALENAIGQNLFEILSSQTSDYYQGRDLISPDYNYIQEKISKGEGFKVEISYFNHGDRGLSPSWLLINGQPIPNQDGNIQEYTLLGTDITSQKESEAALVVELELKKQELKESEELIKTTRDICDCLLAQITLNQSELKLKAFLDNSPAIIYIKDLEGRYQWINREFEYVLETSQTQVFGKTDYDFLPAEVADKLRANDLQAIFEGIAISIDESVILPNGNTHFYIATKFPLLDDQGNAYATGGISFDISDRKFVEGELRQSEVKQRAIISALPDLIMAINSDGICTEFISTDTFKVIAKGEDHIGRSVDEMLPTELAQRRMAAVRNVLSSGVMEIYEQKVTLDNSVQIEEVRVVPYQDHEVLILVRDISDRKIAEINLQRSEARTRSILGAIPDIINLFSPDGIFLESVGANKSRDFIKDASNSVGKHITELIPTDIALAQVVAIREAVSSSQIQIIEQQIEMGDHIQYEEVRIVPTQDGNALAIVRDISEQQAALRERKIAEGALLKSESENRAILSAIPDLIFQVNAEGIYLKRFSTNFVKDAIVIDQNPVGKSIREVLPPNIAELKMHHLQIALETGETQIYEQELIIGEKMQYEEVRIVKISDRTALTMIRNITEQRAALKERIKAEELLRQSEETNRAILSAIPDLLLRVGRDLTCYNCIFPNNNPIALFVPVMNNMAEVLPPDLCQHFQQRIEEALATGELQIWEHKILKYGKLCDEEVRLVPCSKDECLVIVRDISDRKQAEISIQESSAKLFEAYAELDALFSAMTDVVLIRNSQGQCLKVAPTNSNFTLLGTPDEVIGKSIHEELPERQATIILRAISQALETKQTVNCDYKLVVQERETWFSASISPISSDTVIQISRDITERKQAEIALSLAKEHAEALARAKSDFLANMSHEIRTPMNAVLGMARLLSTTTLNAEQLEFVETILDSGDALLVIINDILDFSKIESGTLDLEAQGFNLEDILISTCKLLSNQARSKNIPLEWQTQPELPSSFIGDSSRLRQILLNLVGNAIKFADQGEVKVTVSGHPLKDKKDIYELLFQVTDSGIGIAGDRIIKLFQPFTQADASISRKYGGTGLGLAICKRLVNLMGGTLWLESFGQTGGHPPSGWKYNYITKGSSFYFTIALEVSNQANQKEVKSTELDFNQKLADKFPLRILLAEDNLVNQKVACFTLKKLGYAVDIANNGLEALRAMESCTYDLVFMDLQMPEMDGLTATKLLRQNNPNYPWIVAMTANALPEDRQICLDVGMNDYISKPIDIQEIIRVLSSCDRLISQS